MGISHPTNHGQDPSVIKLIPTNTLHEYNSEDDWLDGGDEQGYLNDWIVIKSIPLCLHSRK